MRLINNMRLITRVYGIPPTIPALSYSLATAKEAKDHGVQLFSIVKTLFDNQ